MRRAITAAAAARAGRPATSQVEEGLSISGVLLAKTIGTGPALVRPVHRASSRLVDLELRSQLAGRWRMADDEHHLRGDPGRDLPGRRPARHSRRDDDRHAGRVHRAAGRPVPPAHGPAQRRRLAGQPRWRCSAGSSSTSTCRSRSTTRRIPVAGRPAAVRGRGAHRATSRSRYPGSRPRRGRRRQPRRAGRHDAGPRRRDRLRQEHAGLAGRPAARPRRRPDHDRRRSTCATCAWPTSPAIVGVVTQETYLLHAIVRENLRYARPDATDAEIVGGRARGADPRPDRGPARGLRHGRRLARPPVLRRRAAAHRDRPNAAARPAGAGPRRGDQRPGQRRPSGRCRRRSTRLGRGPDDDHHRPPALDRARCRPDRGAGPRPGRRVGHARGTGGRRRALATLAGNAERDAVLVGWGVTCAARRDRNRSRGQPGC